MRIPSGGFCHSLLKAHWEFRHWFVHRKNVVGMLNTCICCGRNLISSSAQRQTIVIASALFTQTWQDTWDVFLSKRVFLYLGPTSILLGNKRLPIKCDGSLPCAKCSLQAANNWSQSCLYLPINILKTQWVIKGVCCMNAWYKKKKSSKNLPENWLMYLSQ